MIRGEGTRYSMNGNIDVTTTFGGMKLYINKEGGTTRPKRRMIMMMMYVNSRAYI